jgi:hypothetical protein
MAVIVGKVAVGNTPTLLITTSATGSRVKIWNSGSKSVFVGSETVTVDTGLEIAAGAREDFDCTPLTSFYGIVATPRGQVNVLEY